MKRDEAIELLVENDINTILYSGDHSYLNDIMRIGIKGYDNFTNDELCSEFKDVFNLELTLSDDIEIENAKFISVWDDGVQFIGDCKYNRMTKEIFEVDIFDIFGVDICVEEYALLNDGTKIPFTPAD